MRIATAGPIVTTLLAIGMPAKASTIIACRACVLPSIARQATSSRPRDVPIVRPTLRYGERLSNELFGTTYASAKELMSHSASHLLEAGQSGFSLETDRHIAIRSAADDNANTRDKLSSGSMTLRYLTRLGYDDSLSLGFGAGIEKRRFALDLADGHHIRSQSAGLVVGWTHGKAWQMQAGLRADFGSRRAPPFERSIELTEGAQRSQRGAWAAVNYIVGDPHASGISLGIRAQSFRLSNDDRVASGASGRTDNRLALTATIRFR